MIPVKISLNKTKAIRLFIIFTVLVIASALMVTRPQLFTYGEKYGFIKTVGYVGTVIFVLAATIVSNKVFSRTPGLVIDEEGITDNSMGVLFPKVLWSDILDVNHLNAANENFITVMMKNPETFINSEPNPVKKKMLQLNYQSLKTPINIVASRLKIDFDKLYTTVLGEFEKHKR